MTIVALMKDLLPQTQNPVFLESQRIKTLQTLPRGVSAFASPSKLLQSSEGRVGKSRYTAPVDINFRN